MRLHGGNSWHGSGETGGRWVVPPLGKLGQFAMERLGQREQAWAGGGSVEDKVGGRHFFPQGPLITDASEGFAAGQSIAFLQSGDLGFPIGGDHDDLVHARINAGFVEKRNVVDDDGVWILADGQPGKSRLFSRDAGVDEGEELEVADAASGAVELPVSAAHPGALQVAAGLMHSCAATGGRVYCWGYNGHGELGDGTRARRMRATTVPALTNVAQIVASVATTCVSGLSFTPKRRA